MNDVAMWYLFHGSAAFLFILIVTAIIEHFLTNEV